MYDLEVGLEDFANRCCFTLDGDILTTTCVLRDSSTGRVHRFEKSVDLRPAIDYVTERLKQWHLEQHGDDPSVAGFMDFVKSAVKTVKKVAQNKTVRSIYNQAKPFLKAAIHELPGGSTGLALAEKAADVYQQAKKGSQTALKKVEAVKKLADAGDTKAVFAVNVMKNVKTIIEEKLAGNPTPLLPPVAAALRKQERARGASLYSLGVNVVSGEEPTEYLVGLDLDEDYDDFEYDDEGLVVGFSLKGLAKGIAKKAKWAVPGYAAYRGAKAVAKNPKLAIPGYAAYRGVKAVTSRRKPAPKRGVRDSRAKPKAVRLPGMPGMKMPKLPAASAWKPSKASAPPPRATMPHPSAMVQDVAPPLAAQAIPPPYEAPYTSDLPSEQYAEEELYDEYYADEGYYEDEYYDDGYYDDGYYDDEYYDDQVAGWTYNRPYRTTPQMLVQARKSPGIALSVREVYNRGLGRPHTDLSQLASAALREF